MSYSITTLKNDLTGVLHGTTTNQITNLDGLINRAARQLLEDIDPQETKRIAPISGTVFNGVWDYPLAADVKGNKVIDIRPQILRYPNDVWSQQYNQDFDIAKNLPWSADSFTINFNSSLKSVRINSPFLLPPVLMNQCDTLTGNGTWSEFGGATAPAVDNVNFVSGGGSLMFNLAAGQTTGGLVNSTMSPLDLTDHLNQSTLFLYTYLPDASDVTSVTLTWGSSASDTYAVTATTTQQSTVFQTGWNTLAFPWSGATVTGSPDVTDITYLKVTWTYNSTLQTAVRLGSITSNLGSILDMEYYSKYLFRNASTGAYQETVLDDTDLVNLDTESYNLLFNYVAHLAAQQQQGLDAMFYDGNFFLQKYQEGIARYKSMYKSEVQKPQTMYYRMKKPVTSRFWGNRWNY